MPYFELLGIRGAATALSTNDFGPCVKAALAAGTAVDVSSAPAGSSYKSFDVTSLAAKSTSVHFRGDWDSDMGKDVVVRETSEKTVLGVTEWVALVGAVFDKEAAAAKVFADASAAYDCNKRAIAAAPLAAASKPKVLWATLYNPAWGGWYFGSCPNFYCGLVADAGGEFLTVAGCDFGCASTDPKVVAAFATADVVIYTNNDWDATFAPNLPGAVAPPSADVAALLAKAPAVASKRVFDIWGLGTWAWFALRPAQPALILGDVAAAVNPSAALPAPTLLRNVFTNKAGVGASPLTSLASCDAPMPVVAWDVAPCGGAPKYAPKYAAASAAVVGGIVGGVAAAATAVFLAIYCWPAKAAPLKAAPPVVAV